MKSFYLTDTGKVRSHNEDSLIILENKDHEYLLAVADGMGGCMSGELASNEALKETIIWFEQLNPELYYGTEEI